jgi:hypothetical protein
MFRTTLPLVIVERLQKTAIEKDRMYIKKQDVLLETLSEEYRQEVCGKDYRKKFTKAGLSLFITSEGSKIVNARLQKKLPDTPSYWDTVRDIISDYEYRKAIGQAPELATLVAEIEKLLK